MGRRSLYNVMTNDNKEVLINLRVQPGVREDFRIAAGLRGATMSGLLHQYIFRVIREEKEKNAAAFEDGFNSIAEATKARSKKGKG